MERWTRTVIRYRWLVVGVWAVVLAAGFLAFTGLSKLLANEFSVPGTDSEHARALLSQRFGDRSDGGFTLVFRVPGRSGDPATVARLQALAERAATVVPSGTATPLLPAGPSILYGQVQTRLHLARAKGYAGTVLRALGHPPGAEAYVTGPAAIQHDLDPIFSNDLKKGEGIALPIALAVLLAVFGLSFAVTIPFIFAGVTIFGTLGLVWAAAHWLQTATYVTNLVQLIGLGIAVDYSLLVVYRFREELAQGAPRDEAVVRTMATAGRAVIFSGATVAIGLALLLFMPLPFMRSIGFGGFMIPLVSIAAAATLQPALLAIYGARGTRRAEVARFLRERLRLPLPRFAGSVDVDRGFWSRLSRSIMRRPLVYLAAGTAVLVALAVPVYGLQLTPGSTFGIPRTPQSVHGFDLLQKALGPGAIAPTEILVDAGAGGNALAAPTRSAIGRLAAALQRDRAVASVLWQPGGRFVDPSGRYARVIVAGRYDYGEEPAQQFVSRLRGRLIPGAGFPAGVRVLAGGASPQGVDFLHRAYAVFPYLVVAVLVLTYVVLLRAFRSLLLPLKAVVLNLLSVAASYGILVLTFRHGVGHALFGLYRDSQIEGWIPIFLFAVLFGLSMDYEVFLVTRMRETWDRSPDNERAVAHGLERTGRIITAAAVIMVAAFSGFIAGSIVGLQQFGVGLAAAILIDATIVRAILVPALMAILGRWNWWLPAPVARALRVAPSPRRAPAAHG